MRKGLVVLAVIAFMSFYSINVCAACTTPTSGTRVWDLAATALDIIDSTQSKVCELLSEINTDFNGTFTVEQNILTKVCDNLTLTEQINSSFDQLIVSLPNTVSKLCIIDSKVDVLTTQIEGLQVDISGTFTALDGLKTTVCSKLEHVSTELNQIETTITLLTQTEIDHAITIASQLSELQTDVDLLNSAIDDLNLDANIQGLDSCVDILVSLVDDLDMDVDNLQSTLANGFAGTFTALGAQLLKACTVESLADTAEVTAMVDFSGVFTALEALQEKVCSIDSLVDIVCLINARDVICSTESKIDRALSKICLTQQEIMPLPSLSDVIISKLESVEMAGFDQACSKLEVAINILDSIGSKVDTIESKVCAINVLNNTSKLEVLDAELITIDSQLDTIDVMTSKLCVIDSKIDPLQQTALTIESIIDVIDMQVQTVDSKIALLTSQADLLESKLCEIEPSTRLICSNLDLLLASLQTNDSKLDSIIPLAESNIEQLLTIESRVDHIGSTIDALGVNTLTSKLCVIEDQVNTIESTLDLVGGLIGPLNMQAQELIGDFQETWTILDIIENKLSTAEPTLETITSKLDQELSLDLSGVFTEIEAILQKECTVDSKVDSALLLVDEFVSRQDAIDFSSVFTALDALLVKVCTVDSQVDVLNSKVDNLVTFCGIPIRASDLPLTITTPERYFLAENIDYAGGGAAISITTDNVFLDLNGHTLNATAGATEGVFITTSTNVQVTNGAITNFTRGTFATGCTNVVLSNLNFAGNDLSIRESDIRNMIIRDIFCNSGAFLRAVTSDNITITRCTVFGDLVSTGFGAGFTNNLFMSDCVFKKMGGNAVSSVGTLTNILYQRLLIEGGEGGVVETVPGSSGIIVKDCKLIGGSGDGIQLRSAGGGAAINNMIIGYGERGIEVLANTPINQYIAFNTVIECASNCDEAAATSNTFLGNFAFNSTAVGNPNNTNYNILGSDITGKFVTASQSGSFGDFPTRWHNINMLP